MIIQLAYETWTYVNIPVKAPEKPSTRVSVGSQYKTKKDDKVWLGCATMRNLYTMLPPLLPVAHALPFMISYAPIDPIHARFCLSVL